MSDEILKKKRMGSTFYSKASSKAILIEVHLHACQSCKIMARRIQSMAAVQFLLDEKEYLTSCRSGPPGSLPILALI